MPQTAHPRFVTTAAAHFSRLFRLPPSAFRTPPDSTLLAPLLAVVVLALGYALQLGNGHYQEEALRWLALALGGVVLAVAISRWRGRAVSPKLLTELLGFAVLIEMALYLQKPPGLYLAASWPGGYGPFFAGLAVAALLVGLGVWGPNWRVQRLWFPALLVVHLLLGIWVFHQSPAPRIDVFLFQQGGSAALLRGENPYNLTFPDIYGGAYYAPELREDGHLNIGYIYPPLSVFLILPAYALAGDYRYAHLLALTVAGVALAVARPGRGGALAAALLLFSPRAFFILEQGWNEPLLIGLLAVAVACACRWPRALPLALGLTLSSKQVTVFVPPLALLLVGGWGQWRAWWSLTWRAGAVALVVSLPLALAAPRGFAHSVIAMQVYQPFRTDALSYAAALARAGLPAPGWLAFAAVGAALALALWRGARTPAGFAAGLALTYLAFFAANKQAFANYYFFALGALCCAIAAAQPGTPTVSATGRIEQGA